MSDHVVWYRMTPTKIRERLEEAGDDIGEQYLEAIQYVRGHDLKREEE